MKYELNNEYYLRTVELDDANDIFEFAKIEKVTQFLTWNPHENIDQTKYVIENLYMKKPDNIPANFVIVNNKDEKVVGVIDFMSGRNENTIEIGYFLNPDYWHQGIMTKALSKMLEIGFKELNYESLYIYHDYDNVGSQKVILKNNFKYLKTIDFEYKLKQTKGRLKEYVIKRDDYND